MSTGVQGFLPVSSQVFDFAYDEDLVFPAPPPLSSQTVPIAKDNAIKFGVPLTLTQRKLYVYIVGYFPSGQGLIFTEIVLRRNGSPVGKIPVMVHNFFGTATNPFANVSTPSPFASGGIPVPDSITLFLQRGLVNQALNGPAEPTATPVVYPMIFKGEFDEVAANITKVTNIYSYRLWVGCASSQA